MSGDGFQEVLTYLFSVPVSLLTGNDVVSYSGLLGNDGFIIDYSRLTISDQASASSVSAVPEPTQSRAPRQWPRGGRRGNQTSSPLLSHFLIQRTETAICFAPCTCRLRA